MKTTFLLLEQKETTAVVNLTLTDERGKQYDTYLHFLKQGGKWKIAAFRALAMTGLMEEVLKTMESYSEYQVDSLIQTNKTHSRRPFSSKEDFRFQLENIRLTLASDQEIINYFRKHEVTFEALKNKINQTRKPASTADQEVDLGKAFRQELQDLRLSSASDGNLDCETCLEFTIGGMVDNTVGLLFVPNKEKLPVSNPSNYIMIREIGNGWYLFKTT